MWDTSNYSVKDYEVDAQKIYLGILATKNKEYEIDGLKNNNNLSLQQ